MKLDWKSLEEGFTQALEKDAQLSPAQRRYQQQRQQANTTAPAPQPAPIAPNPAPAAAPQPAPIAPQPAPIAPQPAPIAPQPAPADTTFWQRLNSPSDSKGNITTYDHIISQAGGSGLPLAASLPVAPWLMKKFLPETHEAWSTDPNQTVYPLSTAVHSAAAPVIKGTVATVGGAANVARTLNDPKLGDRINGFIDNIGKFAPLAMGAMILPSLLNRKQQGAGGGQPVVVNNYMGGKPNMLSPMSGVNSLSDPLAKTGAFYEKRADVISKALADAAKRRVANKVLDVVTPEQEQAQHQPSREEIEITTKYPEMRKLLEDEHNKAYLDRLLQS